MDPNAKDRFQLGLFGPNASSGMAPTLVEERWRASWQDNLRLAKLADESGIDFLLPIARWRGYGGRTDFEGEVFETLTWASGLLSATRRLTAFGTVHAPMIHPLVAAKQLVTIQHSSGGRIGLNLVCGWNQHEFEMFGIEQREHDERYAYGAEWLEIVKRLWRSEEPFDFDGRYFRLKGAISRPGPFGGRRPAVMNAGSSTVGRQFGARHCDVLFTKLIDLEAAREEVAAVRDEADRAGRSLAIFTAGHVVVRSSGAEARDYYRHYAEENVDEEALERLMRLHGLYSRYQDGALPPEAYKRYRTWFAAGHGTYPIVGDPSEVAAVLHGIRDLGIEGIALSFVNYLDELPLFVREVVPRLR